MIPVISHPVYSAVPLPERHPFPMGKFQEIERQLRDLAWIDTTCWYQPDICPREIIEQAHDVDYVGALARVDKRQSATNRWPTLVQAVSHVNVYRRRRHTPHSTASP